MDQAKTRWVSYERLFEMMMNKDWAFAHPERSEAFLRLKNRSFQQIIHKKRRKSV